MSFRQQVARTGCSKAGKTLRIRNTTIAHSMEDHSNPPVDDLQLDLFLWYDAAVEVPLPPVLRQQPL